MGIPSLYTAASALQASQQYLDVVANNLANENTVGFKSGRAGFEDALSQTLQSPAANPAGDAMQIGMGTALSAVSTQFTQGPLQSTGVPTDVAINGNGFFVVKDPVSGQISYTRAGSFTVDTNGYLVTPTGQRLQGGAAGAKAGDPLIDMQVPTTVTVGGVAVPVTSFSIGASGQVTALLQDGTTSTVGVITLENFTNPEGLVNVGGNLYQATTQAGAQSGTAGAPTFGVADSGNLGSLESGYLELSNVDLSQQFSDMILAERGLQANARVMTASDEVLQELMNMKH